MGFKFPGVLMQIRKGRSNFWAHWLLARKLYAGIGVRMMVTKVIAIVPVSAVKRNFRSRRDGARYQNLNLNVNVWSAKGSTALQQICAVLVLCALKNSAGNLCWWYKNKKCSNAQWGLAWALKASLKASVLAASIIVSGSSFHCLTDLGKKLYLYILVLQPAFINLSGCNFLFSVPSAWSNLEFLLPGCHLRSYTSLLILFVSFSVPMMAILAPLVNLWWCPVSADCTS